MTNTQIEYFEEVCETFSFSKAAGNLYVSQPAISKSISRLEEEIGYPLFERENSVLTLTRAGELFRDFVSRYKEDYQYFQEQLELQCAQSAQAIRVGCPETWNPFHFYDWIESCFSEAVPAGNLSVDAYWLSDLLLRLKNGKLDFVLSHDLYSPSESGLRTEMLTETGIGILYAKQAFREPVKFNELAEKGFLVYDNDIKKRFSSLIQSICRSEGCNTKTRNGGTLQKCLFELSRGNAVMLFTDWDNFVSNQSFGYYPVKQKLPVRLLYYPDRLTAAGKAFIRELRKRKQDL